MEASPAYFYSGLPCLVLRCKHYPNNSRRVSGIVGAVNPIAGIRKFAQVFNPVILLVSIYVVYALLWDISVVQ